MDFWFPFILGGAVVATIVHFYSQASVHAKLDAILASFKSDVATVEAKVKSL